jgi:Cytosine/adenosine deaminases
MNQHEKFLKMAINLAKKSAKEGLGGPFGAVIVKNGKVIAKAHNSVVPNSDPTAHAEVNAIREACKKLKDFELKDCIIYASAEPCPMCLGAIYWTRPKALYYAADKKLAAKAGFDDSFIYKEIALPKNKRKIKTTKVNLPQDNDPFEEWAKNTNKTEY